MNDQSDVESETPIDPFVDLKLRLLTCLDGIQTTGNVAASKHYESFVNPGLMVGDTLIPLPLVPRDAETIKNASRQAPFGRGDETVVDTSVRNTWELDHTQFKLTNPDWKAYILSLMTDAGKSLAIPQMRAEPYKLLLYEEGSFFKPHKDSEKSPGMMATVVICLPSRHDGGSVHLSHGGKKYTFETDKTSDFSLTTLSWFSDVTHEVKPLRSGYRLVLTYNIIHSDGLRMSASLVGSQLEQLRTILSGWQSTLEQGPGKLGKLIYKLEHKYTQSSLALSNLKGRDQAVCQSLYEAGSDCGFTIFLARLNREHSEEVDEYWDEDLEEYTQLEQIKTCNGCDIHTSESVEEKDILGQIWNRRADSVLEGDYTGNESTTPTLRYHDTVLVIVPTQQLPAFIYAPEPRGCMNIVSQVLNDRPNDHLLQTSSLFDSLAIYAKRGVFSGTFLHDLMSIAIEYECKPLYRAAVRSPLRVKDEPRKVLEKAVQLFKENIKHDREEPNWDFWFGDLLNRGAKKNLTSLQAIMVLVEDLIQGEGLEDLIPSFKDWKKTIQHKMIKSKGELDMNDHDFLVCQLFKRSNDPEWMTWFVSILTNGGSKQLICAILRVIYDKREDNTLTNPQDIYRSILDKCTKKLALEIGDFPESNYITGFNGPHGPLGEAASTIQGVANVIDQCFHMRMTNQAAALLDMSCIYIRESFSTARAQSLPGPKVVRDFLLSLIATLQKYEADPSELIETMFITLLRKVLVAQAPKCPKPPRGFAHKPRPPCSRTTDISACNDCAELNAFLKNPKIDTWEVRVALYRQRHLMEQLPENLYKCTSMKAPQRLHVSKLGKEYKEEMKEYKSRLLTFEDNVRALRCDFVEFLLGKELYEELVMLKNIPESDGSKQVRRADKRKAQDELEGSSASRPKIVN
ncbi:hypothetical protein F4805DRAFT_474356 [Annulohypoxylon moriforme]|nr:hypothetical protein F4805DRAFT_474356 [Annulohypoxylon moriforme]